jgi:glycosyltransferase involved in cell wall biosynthesis
MVIFPNYSTPLFVPGRLGHCVTVIHDLQYRTYPQYFSRLKRIWLRWAHAWTLFRADKVVAISGYVRQTIAEQYGRNRTRKVRVIHNPIVWDRFGIEPEGSGPDAQDRPYVLSVAAHYPHKNLHTLIQAFAQIAPEHPELDLILVGQVSNALGKHVAGCVDLSAMINGLELADRVRLTGFISDGALGDLYRNATVLALPSLYEGFGMPVVEAMGLGVPVLTTRCASLHEVTLGKACYVDNPLDESEWAAKLNGIMSNPAAYKPDVDTAHYMRQAYSPLKAARAYASLLGS